ncbi:MAG: hypothetical protein QXQ43_00620 [Nitrososphaerota archaeon]
MADFRDDLKSLQEGYSKALTFWQNFISPPSEDQAAPIDTSSVVFAPGRNLALENYYQYRQGQIYTQQIPVQQQIEQQRQQLQQQFSDLAQRPEVTQFSSEYAREAALASRYGVNVNPAVMLPQFYGQNIYGLPSLPYLLPPQEQIYRPISMTAGISIAESAMREGTVYNALASSPLLQMYEYNRTKLGVFAESFGTLLPRTLTDIASFSLGEKIAKSIVGRSLLGSIPYAGGFARFVLGTATGMGLAYLATLPITAVADAIKLHSERAEAAEAITREFVTVGPELSPLGKGLRAEAASRLGYNMMRIAERMGAVSYRDVEEILKLGGASGLFMFDQTSTDIDRKLRGLIRIFGEVAKITNDPDMRKHIQNIAEFYKFGGTMEHYLAAVETAGIGSRVTGQSVDSLMRTYGAMGISAFHGMGLVPAYGAMYGIQARTSAQLAVNAGAFTLERLATLGGIEGVTASLIRGQAASAAAFTNLILPSLITAVGGGMGVNAAAAGNIAASANPLFAIQQQPSALARYAQERGISLAQALQDYTLNSNILQSEVMRNNPLLGQVFLMNAANQLSRMTGGQLSTEYALMQLGVDRDTALAMVRTYGNVNALREMRRQHQFQLYEMGTRFMAERRESLSRLGLGFELAVSEPFTLAFAEFGRQVYQESIVTPFREEAQRQALRGTLLYGMAERERKITERDIINPEPNVISSISKWFATRIFSPAYEYGIEAVEGRGLFTGIKAAAVERPILTPILTGLLGGAISALFPVAQPITLALIPTEMSFSSSYSKEELIRKNVMLSRDSKLYADASTYGGTKEGTEAALFLKEWEKGTVTSLDAYVERKFGNLSEKERHAKKLGIMSAIREFEKSSSAEGRKRATEYVYRISASNVFLEEMVGETIKKAREMLTEGMKESLKEHLYVEKMVKISPTPLTPDIATEMLVKVPLERLQHFFTAISSSGEKDKLMTLLKTALDEYQESTDKSAALERFKRRLDEFNISLIDIPSEAGGESIFLPDIISRLTTEDVERMRMLYPILSRGLSRANELIDVIDPLVRGGFLSPAELEKINSKQLANVERFISEKASTAFTMTFGAKGEAAVKARAEKVAEMIQSGEIKGTFMAGRKFDAESFKGKTKEEIVSILTESLKSDLLRQKYPTSVVPSPTSATPGGAVEGQKKLIEGIDKLIEAANTMKKAAEAITINTPTTSNQPKPTLSPAVPPTEIKSGGK